MGISCGTHIGGTENNIGAMVVESRLKVYGVGEVAPVFVSEEEFADSAVINKLSVVNFPFAFRVNGRCKINSDLFGDSFIYCEFVAEDVRLAFVYLDSEYTAACGKSEPADDFSCSFVI